MVALNLIVNNQLKAKRTQLIIAAHNCHNTSLQHIIVTMNFIVLTQIFGLSAFLSIRNRTAVKKRQSCRGAFDGPSR